MGSSWVSEAWPGVTLPLPWLPLGIGDRSDVVFLRFRGVPDPTVLRRVVGLEARGSVRVHPSILDRRQRRHGGLPSCAHFTFARLANTIRFQAGASVNVHLPTRITRD